MIYHRVLTGNSRWSSEYLVSPDIVKDFYPRAVGNVDCGVWINSIVGVKKYVF